MYCFSCRQWFTPSRPDHVFCSDKCRAQYQRDNGGDTGQHAEPSYHARTCNHCGRVYSFNDHAKRGGKRVPKYCSDRCRQAAYRSRTSTSRQQTNDGSTSRQQTNDGSTSRQQTNDGSTSRQQPYWKNPLVGGKLWAVGARELASEILGVQTTATAGMVRIAYKTKIYEVHPDRNQHPDATQQAQAVNWAYSVLK